MSTTRAADDGTRLGAAAPATIVVVEDDPAIADLVDLYLRREGQSVYLAATGQRGLELVAAHHPDLVVLDIGLPDVDGFELCRRLRAAGSSAGIIFLTARDEEIDRVLGLELGADDYVTKPFSPRELVARVKAVLRRADPTQLARTDDVVRIGAIEVDAARREVRLDATPVPFAAREFDLLHHLARHRGQALARRQLIEAVWGDDWPGDERTVDVHVRQLRRKLGDALPLHTVWGVGYRLD
ncbi:MAG: response regulator transcription factor [Microthrixaceae bacterium]